MVAENYDFAIIGSGFSGSILGAILQRIGRRVVILDRAVHPRFAIGESLTPIGNQVLRDLAERFDLPWLAAISRFGSWQNEYPEVVGGLKRGFSYFHHQQQREFSSSRAHDAELLVSASPADDVADTHWLRADVDHFLSMQTERLGVEVIEHAHIQQLEPCRGNNGWVIHFRKDHQDLSTRVEGVIDASGVGGVVPRATALADHTHQLRTHSRALFAHFRGVRPWQSVLEELGIPQDDYPFPCDHAALHHVMDHSWMWQLRFANDLVSAGIMLDCRRHGLKSSRPHDEWRQWINRYPSVQRAFRDASVVDPPGHIMGTGRLQRRWSRAVGQRWLLLPHTFGFIDPLHSTGIAYALSGVERLADLFADSPAAWPGDRGLNEYQQKIQRELEIIDLLVFACYQAIPDPRLFHAATMLYFAAATMSEHARFEQITGEFLLAADPRFRTVVDQAVQQLSAITANGVPSNSGVTNWVAELAVQLAPYNRVGLFQPPISNMYHYTKAPL